MKIQVKYTICVLLSVLIGINLMSCKKEIERAPVWENALYTENVEFGNGEKTVIVKVKAEDKEVIFTLNTDKENLEDALTEHNLIGGEEGPYGLYVKEVNGILADYNINKSYWSISKEGELLMTGVDGETVEDGEIFEFTYTK